MDATWIKAVRKEFAVDLEQSPFVDDSSSRDVVEALTDMALKAHQPPANQDFLARYYNMVRWTMAENHDPEILEAVAHSFFDRLLVGRESKHDVVDWIDWGDLQRLIAHVTVEPLFTDTDTFERNQAIWKKRWSKNQRLPVPRSLSRT